MPKSKYSTEEKKVIKEKILEMFKQGINILQISVQLGCHRPYVYSIKAELINEGRITDEEIAEARQKNEEKKRTELAEARQKTEKDQKDKLAAEKETEYLEVIRLFKEGLTLEEIGKRLGKCQRTICRIKQNLIEQGRITEAEIDERIHAKSRKKYEVLELLKKGLTSISIGEELDMDPGNVYQIKKKLIDEGLITAEEIEISRQIRIEVNLLNKDGNNGTKRTIPRESVDKAIELLKEGKASPEIARYLGVETKNVNELRQYLIRKGLIDPTEFQGGKKESKAEKKEEVLQLLRKGMSNSSIAKQISETGVNVSKIRRTLISEGLITDEEIEECRKRMAEQKKMFNRHGVKVSRMLRQGYKIQQIAEKTGIPEDQILGIINMLIEDVENLKLHIVQYVRLGDFESIKKVLEAVSSLQENPQYADAVKGYKKYIDQLISEQNKNIDR